MAKVIPVSFKTDEMDLYEAVTKHSSSSGFIKDCIRFYLENKNQNKKPSRKTARGGELDKIIDI